MKLTVEGTGSPHQSAQLEKNYFIQELFTIYEENKR